MKATTYVTERPEVRVSRSLMFPKRLRAAKTAVRFIRRTAECRHPVDVLDLKRIIWVIYNKLRKAGLLAAPRLTGAMLRSKYGRKGSVR